MPHLRPHVNPGTCLPHLHQVHTSMPTTDPSPLNESWPAHGLEEVPLCPFCASNERTLAFKDVQDWSFYTAPGKWVYWDCQTCGSLYLDPRPNEATIGKAYQTYYTHGTGTLSSLAQIKTRIKNECFSHWLGTNLEPRLHLPSRLALVLAPFRGLLIVPFGLKEIVELPKGKLLDIGCGSGDMLKTARSLGWNASGLEIDPDAVRYAQSQGLKVLQGSFHDAQKIDDVFDCIVCSHVLEHVHQPNTLLDLLAEKLAPGGVLLLSLPNSKSHLREMFGESWRGIEAPRHLAIPSLNQMQNALMDRGFAAIEQTDVHFATYLESNRIKNRKLKTGHWDFFYYKIKRFFQRKARRSPSDFIQIVARKNA